MLEDYKQTLEMFNLYHLVSTIIISSINTSFDPYCWKVKIDFKIFNCMSMSYIMFIVLLCLTIKYSHHVNLFDLVYDCFSEKYIYNDTFMWSHLHFISISRQDDLKFSFTIICFTFTLINLLWAKTWFHNEK